jgi:hypothetical protein
MGQVREELRRSDIESIAQRTPIQLDRIRYDRDPQRLSMARQYIRGAIRDNAHPGEALWPQRGMR